MEAETDTSAAGIAPDFAPVLADVDGFALESFNDPAEVARYSERFGLAALCRAREADRVAQKYGALDAAVIPEADKPCEPVYADLCRLHWLALKRRALNVLEFGSGFSTAVLADAMRRLHGAFAGWAGANLRVDEPFHVYSIEEEQRFLDITKARLGETLAPFADVSRSSVTLGLHDNRICTFYDRLPNISPDFIYLDGPSQYASMAELNGFSIASRARMPMAADLLRFEFFLEPGTLIVVDGRTANARFLQAYFKRDWAHRHDPEADVHYFELQETPLGPYNARKLAFSLEGSWLLAR